MAKTKARYKVLVGVESDKKGTRFEPGDFVTDDDFPAKIIKLWLDQGVLKTTRGGAK